MKRISNPAKKLLFIGTLFIEMGLVLLAGYAWIIYTNQSGMFEAAAKNRKSSLLTSTLPGSRYIDIPSWDGINLHAVYFPGQNRAGVLLIHGYQTSSEEMAGTAKILAEEGYSLLIPDMRAHGLSGGDQTTWGQKEVQDLDVLFQWFTRQFEVDYGKVGLLGDSMGGSLGILAASQNPGIAGLIAISPYDSIENLVIHNITQNTHLPEYPTVALYLLFFSWRVGNMEAISPLSQVSKIAPRPVLVMMGGQDSRVDPQGAYRLMDAAGNPKEIWYEAEGEHCDFINRWPQKYREKILNFFGKALKISGNE